MADSNTNKGEGLVKKLLFPGFTDSGSNGTFRVGGGGNHDDKASDSSSSEASTAVQNNLSLFDTDTPVSHSMMDTASEGAFSEASTQVRNNFSAAAVAAAASKVERVTLARVVETPTRKQQHEQPKRDGTPESCSSPPHQPPSFFASTKPAVVHHSSPPLGPESPPKLPRRPLPAVRNISTVADAGSYSDTAMTKTRSKDLGSKVENDSFVAPEQEIPPSPPAFTGKVESSDDDHDHDHDTAGDDDQGEVTQTMILSEEAKLDHDKEEEELEANSDPVWEEEATPAQTAFGKELLFRRKERPTGEDGASDVFSTASEMGTIVGMETSQRMKDLEDMGSSKDDDDDDEGNDTFGSPILPNEDYAKPLWQDESISLPILEMSKKKDENKIRKERVEEEKKVADSEVSIPAKPEPAKDKESAPEGKATGMLSMAIRRIGSFKGGGGNQRSSQSAPNTPRAAPLSPISRWDRTRQSPRTPRTPRTSDDAAAVATPQSFLLRSPGSSAYTAASAADANRYTLSPRFSIWNKDTSPNGKQRDKQRAFGKIPEDETAKEETLSKQKIPFQIARSCLSLDAYDTSMDEQYEFTLPDIEAREMRQSIEHSQRWMEKRERSNVQSVLRNSKSWDVAGSSQASAFRPAPHARDRNRVRPSAIYTGPGSPLKSSNRVRIMSDTAMESKVAQRIEIERADALDILSCLVERGISWHQEESTIEGLDETAKDAATRELGALDVSSVVDDLRDLSKEKQSKESDHTDRILVLDELLRAHEYTLEMTRASQSASSWLASIGRSITKKDDDATVSEVSSGPTEGGSKIQTAGEAASESIALLTTRAMLHSAQMEAKEKSEQAGRLNEELAKCRAEIGRLTVAAQSVSFKSPNRSILDETNDDDESDAEDGVIDRSFENASPIHGAEGVSGFLDEPFLFADEAPGELKNNMDQPSLRSALDEANKRIRKLHGELKSSDQAESVPEEAPIVQVASLVDEKSKDGSLGSQDERLVNVRMLDGENFVTDWAELAPPLPPPPDHGLRSPIVATVLEQWTVDNALHESLLSWIDQVLGGADPEHIPPLTISSLDHQVRDGFAMHVLPLLLRRQDIRVDVQTRAHRRTSYDMAVGVESIGPRAPFDVRRHLETTSARSRVGAASVTHSATTTLMSNGAVGISTAKSFPDEFETRPQIIPGLSYDEMADGMSSVGQPPAGLMSALGGALGGLLTRRKTVTLADGGGSDVGSMAAAMDSPGAGLTQDFGFIADGREEGEEHEPYHRVVSAPPGRIGVTFVEYRGHAMVSDVAPDSPLGGWIFPSDILIAIDELPVSGMRVRDIITVLKDRKERQRALRVISSHDMSEFTLNASVVVDTSG
jgi:hypothetical protein